MMNTNVETNEELLFINEVYSKLAEAEAEVELGKVSDAREGLRTLREKYDL